MLTLKNISYNKTLNFLSFVTFFCSFFLWGLSNTLNLAYIILFPLILYLFNNPSFLLKKKNIFVQILFISLILHFFIFSEFKLEEIPQSKLLKFIYLYLLIIFCLKFFKNFIINMRKLLLIFIYFYLIILLIENILISDHFIDSYNKFLFFNFCESFKSSLFRANFLFQENSHLGMINVGICTASLFYLKNENSKINKLLIYIYLIISLTNGSTTFYVGLFVSSLIIVITSYKQLNFSFIKYLSIYNLLVILIFFQAWDFYADNQCSNRIKELKATNMAMLDLKENIKSFEKKKNFKI